uniref:Uncharacterized protein n=1 Tax=Eutreptiella gymnastica TaxID=73025 RepID=A0A7S4D2M4_9EUGL
MDLPTAFSQRPQCHLLPVLLDNAPLLFSALHILAAEWCTCIGHFSLSFLLFFCLVFFLFYPPPLSLYDLLVYQLTTSSGRFSAPLISMEVPRYYEAHVSLSKKKKKPCHSPCPCCTTGRDRDFLAL